MQMRVPEAVAAGAVMRQERGKVEASVARRLRAPPEALKPQELDRKTYRPLTRPSVRLQQSCHLRLFASELL